MDDAPEAVAVLEDDALAREIAAEGETVPVKADRARGTAPEAEIDLEDVIAIARLQASAMILVLSECRARSGTLCTTYVSITALCTALALDVAVVRHVSVDTEL